MTLTTHPTEAKFEQSKNPMAEVREALPSANQADLIRFHENAEGQGSVKDLRINSMIYKKKPKKPKQNFVKMGLRMFFWVFVGFGFPYYGYYFWKGYFYTPGNGEEKIAAFFLLLAIFLMGIGSQRKRITVNRDAEKSL